MGCILLFPLEKGTGIDEERKGGPNWLGRPSMFKKKG